jgi:serine/threonine-protein kinase
MGTVLLARHEVLDQDVAIKVLVPDLAENPEFVLRLTREAKAVAKLRSEHVVKVIDVDSLEGVGPYMVMEFLRGRSLREETEARGLLPVAEVARYVLQALDALAEAHALGIVHRDLKPSNLFLVEGPAGARHLKVLDFGISKVGLLSEPTHDLTATRALLGTPAYMSPEQLRNPRDVDARADVWSLGVVMYELLTGQTPFQGRTVGELCFAIAETTPKSTRLVRKEVPRALDNVVLRCLKRDPKERFADAAALTRALLPIGGRPARWTGRTMSVGGMLVAGVVVSAYGWRSWRSTDAHETPPSLDPPVPLRAEVAVPSTAEPPLVEPRSVPVEPPVASSAVAPLVTLPLSRVRSAPAASSWVSPTKRATSAAPGPDLDSRH